MVRWRMCRGAPLPSNSSKTKIEFHHNEKVLSVFGTVKWNMAGNNSRPASRVGVEERPRTRWRRDESSSMSRGFAEDRPSFPDNNQVVQKQHSDDRPTSRRGAGVESRAAAAESITSNMGRVIRPGSSSRQGLASRVSGKINVADRPITQQQGIMRPPSATALRGTGLKPVATGAGGGVSQRQVQDRSYFMGILRGMMNEMSAEINKLRAQSEELRSEQAAALVYEKQVRELAEELTGLQEQLNDYNNLIDRLNTGADVSDVNAEITEVNKECEVLNKEVDKLFSQKQGLEEQANKLKEQLKQELQITETLVSQLSLDDQERFAELQLETTKLDANAEQLQNQLTALNMEKSSLEEQIADSEIHQEFLRLKRRLRELTTRRDALVEEENSRQSPGQQRDSLLALVKSHNTELSALDAQTNREKQHIASLQASISQAQQALEQSGSERQSQFTELKKREAVMEEFLSTFDSSMREEKTRRAQLEAEVVEALTKCSSLLVQTQQLPSVEQFGDQIGIKEGKVERTSFTPQGLAQQETQLKLQLQRVNELDQKVSSEMTMLRSKMVGMQTEMERLTDLPALRNREEMRKKDIEKQKEQCIKNRDEALAELKNIQEDYAKVQDHLDGNELWAQLSHLEQKWSQAAQNNNALAEHLSARQALTNFQPFKEQAMNLVAAHNRAIKEVALKSRHS